MSSINPDVKNYLKKIEKKYTIKSKKLHYYFFLRKIFFYLLGFFNCLILKKRDEVPDHEAVILGRGASVIKYYKSKKSIRQIKHIFVVNFRKDDIPPNYLKTFNSKIVHLFISVAEVIPPMKYLLNLQIGKVLFSRCDMMKKTQYGKRKSFKANIMLNRLEYMPDEMINYWWLQNSGLFAICYMAKVWKLKKIYLFGFNFYSGNYLNGSIENELKKANKKNYSRKEFLDLIAASEKLKKNFIRLVKDCRDTVFYFHGSNSFETNLKNLIFKN